MTWLIRDLSEEYMEWIFLLGIDYELDTSSIYFIIASWFVSSVPSPLNSDTKVTFSLLIAGIVTFLDKKTFPEKIS